ncbi:decapping endonuclease targeting mRNA [Gnomoniopsis sp. IMI 355080]|nr:decapping endonuclease targeting mRNA [Gnomoniopsis sp. IMI 355080]
MSQLHRYITRAHGTPRQAPAFLARPHHRCLNMNSAFSIQPIGRFHRPSEPVKRPKEFACFSYDDEHKFHLGDQCMRWYYTPQLGADLSKGFETFVKHDDSVDEHLDSLLKTITDHEQKTGQKIDAQIVTWRGCITKIMASPFENRDGYVTISLNYAVCCGPNATASFIEENHAFRMESQKEQAAQPWRGPIPQEKMQFWGYKFETLSTLPAPWGETSREYIENRDNEVVNNEAQYCSVVRTGIGKSILCLGGEVDAIWDSKPRPGAPINWVELKTSAEIRNDRDRDNFERKLMKFWIQSFLLGVPKIIVGFRSREGILQRLEEIEVEGIPDTVARGRRQWDGNMCINFAAEFLEWLRTRIDDEGVWRIRRRAGATHIEVVKTSEDTGHGRILTDEFINHRIKLSLPKMDTGEDAGEIVENTT